MPKSFTKFSRELGVVFSPFWRLFYPPGAPATPGSFFRVPWLLGCWHRLFGDAFANSFVYSFGCLFLLLYLMSSSLLLIFIISYKLWKFSLKMSKSCITQVTEPIFRISDFYFFIFYYPNIILCQTCFPSASLMFLIEWQTMYAYENHQKNLYLFVRI